MESRLHHCLSTLPVGFATSRQNASKVRFEAEYQVEKYSSLVICFKCKREKKIDFFSPLVVITLLENKLFHYPAAIDQLLCNKHEMQLSTRPSLSSFCAKKCRNQIFFFFWLQGSLGHLHFHSVWFMSPSVRPSRIWTAQRHAGLRVVTYVKK